MELQPNVVVKNTVDRVDLSACLSLSTLLKVYKHKNLIEKKGGWRGEGCCTKVRIR